MNTDTIKQLTRSRDLRNVLNKEASWEDLLEQNIQKAAGLGAAFKAPLVKTIAKHPVRSSAAIAGAGGVGYGTGTAINTGLDLVSNANQAAKDVSRLTKNLSNTVTDFDKSGLVSKATDTLDEAKKAAEGASSATAVFDHLKRHKGKYAIGAGGLAALAAYAVYRSRKEDDEDDDAEARRKEREIRALNRMARAQESS